MTSLQIHLKCPIVHYNEPKWCHSKYILNVFWIEPNWRHSKDILNVQCFEPKWCHSNSISTVNLFKLLHYNTIQNYVNIYYFVIIFIIINIPQITLVSWLRLPHFDVVFERFWSYVRNMSSQKMLHRMHADTGCYSCCTTTGL